MKTCIIKRSLEFKELFSFRSGHIGDVPSYSITDLKKHFGEPARNLCEKVQRQWTVALMEGERELAIFTVYDWYGEHWNLGGDSNSKKYKDVFMTTLRETVETK